METCANCGRAIGKMEPAHVHQDRVVCEPCLQRLQFAATRPSGPPPLPTRDAQSVPRRGLDRNSKIGFAIVGGILLLVVLVGALSPAEKPANAPAAKLNPPGFSDWDGSHHAFVRALKAELHDPSSFEHVQTRYWDSSGVRMVTMKYRANNAFGAKVLSQRTAECTADGRLIRVLE